MIPPALRLGQLFPNRIQKNHITKFCTKSALSGIISKSTLEGAMQKIRLITNVGKSQISESKEFFHLKKIPVTVDGAVMNGLLYRAEDNAKGMPSINGRVMTLGHPKNDAGEFISASEGEALVNHFSGGSVEKNYHVNGVHYVDAKIRKATLKAQKDGEWYYNQLESKKPIGVSTGLFSGREMTEGVNNSGTKYFAIATNQKYDHLALLHESEAPAGGKDTFINFNADATEIVVNLDAFVEANEDQGLFDKLVSKVLATLNFAHSEETRYNHTDDVNVTEELNTNEDNSMHQKLIALLAAKGFTANADMTVDQLTAELEKALDTNSANKGDEVPAWAKDLAANMADMKKEMSDMKKKEMTAEEEAKAKKAKALAGNSKIAALGLDEASLLAMNSATLDNLYAKNVGTITGNAFAGAGESKTEDEVF